MYYDYDNVLSTKWIFLVNFAVLSHTRRKLNYFYKLAKQLNPFKHVEILALSRMIAPSCGNIRTSKFKRLLVPFLIYCVWRVNLLCGRYSCTHLHVIRSTHLNYTWQISVVVVVDLRYNKVLNVALGLLYYE